VELAGQVAIVTGGASGLGGATAEEFAAAGASVAVLDRDADRGGALAARVGGLFVGCDVGSAESATAAVEQVVEQLGVPRILVCCAGVGAGARMVGRRGPHELEAFERVIRINLTGTFNLCRLVAWELDRAEPIGPDGERGVFVTTSSIAAFDGVDGGVAYSASKGGVAGMTLAMARDLAPIGVRVVSIAPGSFATPMVDTVPPDYAAQMAASTPFPPRFGKPPEFAKFARHIVENPMLNGDVIRLDGGMRMTPSRLR
jgi:NAD(P)-dependent dehydrogenase (short-subunit alcohol dehydrogenase family)